MRKLISLLLCISLLAMNWSGYGATMQNGNVETSVSTETIVGSHAIREVSASVNEMNWNQDVKFTGMSDPTLLPYIEDTVYCELVADLNTDEYFIEDVRAVYISQEYLKELAYNSRTNVFFGYSLADLDAYFEGTRYVFTLGDDGQTTVKPLEIVEDTTYEQILKNVAIGTGVILVCVTVSAVTAGAGTAPAVCMIFAVAAKSAAVCALSGACIGGVTAATVRGYQTGDLNEALKAGAVGASEGYKWGAISGAINGGAREAFDLYSLAVNELTMNDVAQIQMESHYPPDIIKQFHSMDEYNVFKEAHLEPHMINKKLALIRTDIDLTRTDKFGRTNLERMLKGLAPLDSNGESFQLHHIGQENDGTLAILTSSEHDSLALHGFKTKSEIKRPPFKKTREEFWRTMANLLSGGI